MARADRRQAARQARQVQRRPRAAGGGTQIAEDTMFFPRLRNHAKWVFVFLIVIFAGGFVFLGVGSGSAGLGDVLQGNWSDIFSSSSSSSAQIKKDQRLIKDNPKDYAAYKDLAAAQAADGKLDDAIVTLLQLKTANPKDVEGLSQLASIYVRKADIARTAAVAAQAKAQTVVPQSTFAPAPTSAFGKAYSGFSAPISSAVEGKVNEQFQTRLLEDDVGLQPGCRRVPGRGEAEPERREHPGRARPDGRERRGLEDGDRGVQAVPEARAGRLAGPRREGPDQDAPAAAERLHRLAGLDSRPHKPGGKRDELRHQDRTGE